MQLPVPDIDGVDLRRASRQEHLREAARRGADIERNAPRRIEAERIEPRFELQRAARDVIRGFRQRNQRLLRR